MCGIAGFVGPGGIEAARAMMRHLAHRGPDGASIHEEPDWPLFLVHTRLAIVDPAHAHQPMWDGNRQIGLIFNGEIYNHIALRSELEAKGHRFATDHSDTETVVHGYAEWGVNLFTRLNGMFALCIFDRRTNSLVLARDRMGEKPLYDTEGADLFAFASEPNALFAHTRIPRILDERGIQKFFAYGYSPGDTTVFRGIRKLLPGEILTFDLASGKARRDRFYVFRIEPKESANGSREGQLAEELGELIDRAVALRLVADVPVGLLLSGGIDSSAILAAACCQRPAGTVDAFTIGFEEPSFDESAAARRAAQFAGCRHHLRMLSIDSARNTVARIFRHLGEPFGDPSILPTAILAGFAREHVTVALSGDGGDELFAGYDPFLALGAANIYDRYVPTLAHRALRHFANYLPISDKNISLDFKLRRTLMGLTYSRSIRLPVWMSSIEPDEMREFFANPMPADELYSEAIDVWNANVTGNDVDKALEFFTRLYLPDDILMKSDRAAMMHSLETRAVFLDNDIVDFAARLPHRYKLRAGIRKWLLRKSLDKRLPKEIVARTKKGFGIPMSEWLRQISPPQSRTGALINDGEVHRRWNLQNIRQSDQRFLLWSWLGLQEMLAPTGTN
jgi:asparagine synthase (glutamine-hydrolysing)